MEINKVKQIKAQVYHFLLFHITNTSWWSILWQKKKKKRMERVSG